ncbi:hypothetical protein bsdtb5_11150 [Anaeromicropila herbilytica]|uniref:Sporulation stage II protein D amidase enhancer LytB N-terminal domain-containing protein n=2 Tax=Anaeromicropila herbilytica TaxID=2785025 RepID=A0A7R7EJB6_9FIRM|nr:hypothetical protein bsdtb5_11150 [Anaeromicropila herbilytica]
MQLNSKKEITKGEDNKQKEVTISMNGDQITRAQMAKMMSFLFYSEVDCSNLNREISYNDTTMNDWYDEYINAIYSVGIMKEDKVFRPMEWLTYEDTKKVMEDFVVVMNAKVADSKLNITDITDHLGFKMDEKKPQNPILKSEWLSVYDTLLNEMKVLSQKTANDDSKEFLKQSSEVVVTKLYVVGTDKTLANLSEPSVVGEDKIYSSKGYDFKEYEDNTIEVYTSGDEIVCMKDQVGGEISLNNVYILSSKDKKISAFINGYEKTFYAQNELSEDVKKVVGDLVIQDKKVVKVKIKPDTIKSKVITATKDYVELEDYGKVHFEDNYKIYKLYGDLAMEQTNSILVGYKNADFVITNGKICAVLIKESINAKTIRVLIKTSNYQDIFHKDIKFKVNSTFTIKYGKNKKTYKAGKVITIKSNSKFLKDGRLVIDPNKENSKITILSITRSSGHPQYRGSMEIKAYDEGLTLINELPLEEYLYAVVPSEMPNDYGTEALKVQAICARSYAVNQLMNNSRSDYGAHVDDSSSYQVYNNYPETKESILAVKDTYGNVLEYNNSIILAYYFSTSCGYTTSARDVWGTSGELKYLMGSFQSNKKEDLDLTDEKKFRDFILSNKIKTYDKKFPWYRWNVTISAENLKKSIDSTLASRYIANPNLIKTLVTSKDQSTYKSIPIDTIGEVQKIQVESRGTGGIITELIIEGSKNTVKILTEYNIRTILAPIYDTISRQDGSKVSNLTMLPSAFFVVDRSAKNGGNYFTFHGGGYGHGVGMSQNGVKALTDDGKNYKDILSIYYAGTKLANIYKK